MNILRARNKKNFILLDPSVSKVNKIHFIVPVYREFRSANLQRMLQSMEKQGRHQSVNIVLLVNNSQAIAQNKTSDIFTENQETIRWLREQSFPFSVDIVDLSTDGVERNMGRIRQIGVERVIELVGNDNLHEHLVVHLDADTHFPENFIERLFCLYGSYAELDTVYFLRGYELRNTPTTDLLYSHFHYQMRRAILDFYNVRTCLSEGLATYQISSRLSALQKVGGFRPLVQHEDQALVEDLCRKTIWVQDSELEMRTEDRAREDGFTAQRRHKELRNEKTIWWKLREIIWGVSPFRSLKKPVKEFFQYHFLFHSLCVDFWKLVKDKKSSYVEAVEEVRRRLEIIFQRTVEVESTRFFKLSQEEILALSDDVILKHRGYMINLNPVAHAFPDLILKPTYRPGCDLWEILVGFLSEEERKTAESWLEELKKKHDTDVAFRRLSMEKILAGEHPDLKKDSFLLWFESNRSKWLRYSSKKIIKQAEQYFPGWLADFDEMAKDLAYLKISVRMLAQVYTQPYQRGGVEDFTQRLCQP